MTSPVGRQDPAAAPRKISDRTWRRSLIGLTLLAIGLTAAVGVSRGLPRPEVADEFCYLLQGETFSKGRLAMPQHSLWRHFQSFYLIQDPVYAAKYPPGQGAVLALGFLLGHPIVGVWLSLGALVLSSAWMLAAFVSRRWALYGGCLVLLGLGLAHPWAQNYWGGAVAGIGGALVFGGFGRLADSWRARDAAWTGLGLAVLGNTRPYEGLVVAAVPLLVLAALLVARARRLSFASALRPLAPLLLIVAALGVWTGVYNQRLTGSPWTMPYAKHHAENPIVPLFVWQERVKWQHQDVWVWNALRRSQASGLDVRRSPPGFSGKRTHRNWLYARTILLSDSLLFGLLLVPFALRQRGGAAAVCALLLLTGAHLLAVPYFPHYSAPGLAALVLLPVAGLACLSRMTRLRPVGYGLAGVVLAWTIHGAYTWSTAEREANYMSRMKPEVRARIEGVTGRHVVLVAYGRHHRIHQEWVYNSADIDSQRVVWAHDLGDPANQKLYAYYSDRWIWSLTTGVEPERNQEPKLERVRAPGGAPGP